MTLPPPIPTSRALGTAVLRPTCLPLTSGEGFGAQPTPAPPTTTTLDNDRPKVADRGASNPPPGVASGRGL